MVPQNERAAKLPMSVSTTPERQGPLLPVAWRSNQGQRGATRLSLRGYLHASLDLAGQLDFLIRREGRKDVEEQQQRERTSFSNVHEINVGAWRQPLALDLEGNLTSVALVSEGGE